MGGKMKQLVIFFITIIISSINYANVPSTNNHSKLNSLGNAWKTYSSVIPTQNHNDINIVYGGQDISLRPTFSNNSTFA